MGLFMILAGIACAADWLLIVASVILSKLREPKELPKITP